MKRILSAIASILLACVFTISAFAEDAPAAKTEILKGTPVLDGVLDDIYLDSATYILPEKDVVTNVNNVGVGYSPDLIKINAEYIYLLHDDAKLYVCAKIHDETMIDTPYGVRNRQWIDDKLDVSIISENGSKNEISFNPFGYMYSGAAGSITDDDVEYKSTRGTDYYIVEASIDLSQIQITDGTILLDMYIADIQCEKGEDGNTLDGCLVTWGDNSATSEYTLSSTEAKASADTTATTEDTAADTTADTTEDTTEDTENPAPDTADIAISVMSVAVCAVAVSLIIKKKIK